jgi:hypothetical protein
VGQQISAGDHNAASFPDNPIARDSLAGCLEAMRTRRIGLPTVEVT